MIRLNEAMEGVLNGYREPGPGTCRYDLGHNLGECGKTAHSVISDRCREHRGVDPLEHDELETIVANLKCECCGETVEDRLCYCGSCHDTTVEESLKEVQCAGCHERNEQETFCEKCLDEGAELVWKEQTVLLGFVLAEMIALGLKPTYMKVACADIANAMWPKRSEIHPGDDERIQRFAVQYSRQPKHKKRFAPRS